MAPYATEGSPWVELLGWCSVIVYGSIHCNAYLNLSKNHYLLKHLKFNLFTDCCWFAVSVFTGMICYLLLWPLLTRLCMSPTGFSPNTAVARSVSSQTPTTWAQYFIDLHLVLLLFPAGLGSILLKANPSEYFKRKRASIAYMENTVDWHFYSSSHLSNLFHCHCHVSLLF